VKDKCFLVYWRYLKKKEWVNMSSFIDYLIIFWGFFMIAIMGIGGFFMFRKFLKQLPKKDGMSEMDWQEYYLGKTLHMWNQEEKDFLEELVAPVPELFRDVARRSIASKIGQLALERGEDKITRELVIEGYIIGTPKRDHRFLRKTLAEKNIDIEPYEQLFQLSKKDYAKNWQQRYKVQ